VSNFGGAKADDKNWDHAAFSINSAFVSGVNLLTFYAGNYGGPGGMLVQGLGGSVSPFDTDGDGVLAATDQCPNSILAPTVVINECDSNAPNHLYSTGCTRSDLIAEATASTNGQCEFVGVVGFLTQEATKSGVISGSDKGAIQKCAAKAMKP
jgi:hypothetical protein